MALQLTPSPREDSRMEGPLNVISDKNGGHCCGREINSLNIGFFLWIIDFVINLRKLTGLLLYKTCVQTYSSMGKMANIFVDNICKCILLNENMHIFLQILLSFFVQSSVDNKWTLVHIMSWCQRDDKPLPEPMVTKILRKQSVR